MWREIRFFPIQWRDKGKFENFPNSVMEYWQRIVEKLPEIKAFLTTNKVGACFLIEVDQKQKIFKAS